MKVFLGIIGLLILALLLIYGTISPCGILKKEVANEAAKSGGQGAYILFGGFIDRGIDTLNPVQCLSDLYKLKTEGLNAALNTLGR